jgi:hypothetical protein
MSTDRDLNTLYAAVGRAMSAWETLEANFSYLYAIFVGSPMQVEAQFYPLSLPKSTTSPNRSIGRVQGTSFSSETCHLIIIDRVFRKDSAKVLRVERDQ